MTTMIGRAEFCTLVGRELEAVNALHRRGQMPLVPNIDLPERARSERGYSPTGALALIVADEFATTFGISREQAAAIAVNALALIGPHWKRVADTSAGAKGEHVLFGVTDWKGAPKRGSRAAVAIGTLPEIASQYPKAENIVAIDATKCVALLRQRAAKAKIDLAGFWDQEPRDQTR